MIDYVQHTTPHAKIEIHHFRGIGLGRGEVATYFLPRCMECSRGIAMRILSVRLSVCLSVRLSVRLSVKRVHCDKTEESYV